MEFRIATKDILQSPGELLLVPVFENEVSAKKRPDVVARLDRALGGLVAKAAGQEGFKGKADQSWTFHTHGKTRADRVILLGLGPVGRFTPETLRHAAGRGARAALKLKAGQVSIAIPPALANPDALKAVAEGLTLGAYRFDRYRTQGGDDKGAPRLALVHLHLPVANGATRELTAAAELGAEVGQAVNWARDMTNEPAAVMTPARLAEEAKSLAKRGLHVSVTGQKEIEKLRMGLFLGVAQGSVLEPKLIQVKYTPKKAQHAKAAPLALVGKAITFDSGGLSLKTNDGMLDMKTDMAGSAAVLGAMRVIAALQPPFPVIAMIGACENMPSGSAYRPGDVLISRLGKTVEITNTDAEGRLVLGDMLSYANEQKPFAMVDLATLTGACVVALGQYITGAFGEDEGLVGSVLAASKRAGEEMWRLPVTDLQKDALRSEIADMRNTGERWGGAINAALFLREFVGETPWVHLDIAGPSQSPKERGYFLKGATGVGVRTLVELVRQKANA